MNQAAPDAGLPDLPQQAGVDFVRVRFAGDSGDGVQTTGALFTQSAADFGNDFATFPDYPAEIRAPAGTTAGVSAYSLNIGSGAIYTHGDQPDVLVAFNAAALAMHWESLNQGGLLLLDSSGMTPRLINKAGFKTDPRKDGSLDAVEIIELDISSLTLAATANFGLTRKQALRARNMWALGLTLWLFARDEEPVARAIARKFSGKPEVAESNLAALRAGHAYGETHEIAASGPRYDIGPAPLPSGLYRAASGSEALTLGVIAAARLAGLPLFYASYPITPASPILHRLAGMRAPDVSVFQAEDEIAAASAAIGAAFGGCLSVTASSGPGLALMTEALGLAIAAELPLLVIDVQRAGPSTGMPTKTEQSDLLFAATGRNGDTPLPVIAAKSPSDCFDAAIEAARIAIRHMTPAILLADAYLVNAAAPWRLPAKDSLDPVPLRPSILRGPGEGHPFRRDPETLGRDWPVPGTPGLEHRIGGLERDADTGQVSYDPANHQRMTEIRCGKIDRIRDALPNIAPEIGSGTGPLAVLGWGSTYGAIHVAVRRARAAGLDVDHIHLRHLSPLPPNLETLLEGYEQVLLPELNMGQLASMLRGMTRAPVIPLRKVAGQPFLAREISGAILEALGG